MKQSGLKYNVSKRLILKAQRKNQRKLEFPRMISSLKIGIVTDEHIKEKLIINSFFKQFQLSFLLFNKRKRKKEEQSDSIFLTDLNFWGIPNDKKIVSFVQTPFDILINLSDERCVEKEYVCAKSLAKFKVGIISNDKIYDLIIDLPFSKVSVFFDELERIIKNFNI